MNTPNGFSTQEKLEQYKSYMQDLANLGSRHETSRGFYLSLLTALLSVLALSGEKGLLKEISHSLVVMVAMAGIGISILWFFNALTFSALFAVKFKLIGEMEKALPFQIFDQEYEYLQKDWKYKKITYVECVVALLFACLFSGVLVLTAVRF